ncbi:GmrSD restriction endonuclease domain-containing protein [Propionibacteriaceae bacterium G1746]
MKAVDSHLLTLLKASSQFIVPIYQRLYSWQEPECAQLWADIIRAGSTPTLGSHFTGSIVYVAKDQSTNTSADPDLIIDGQQRVTTVTLILAALAARLDALPEDQREPWDGFSPRKIRNRYLINDDEEGERQFKLILSQSDKQALIAILQGTEPANDMVTRVIDNYAYFTRKLEDPQVDLSVVSRGLDKLVVVDVKLERGVDNPQLVFEAMNSTGKKLSQADLIRNYVLMDLPPKQQEKLYSAYWRPMELEFAGADESQFDEFVRHYLTIKTGEIPRLGDIYDAFKTHAVAFTGADETIESLVIELRQYAGRYCAMALGRESDPKLQRAFKDLDQIKADVVYPFLLEVYSDYELGTLSRDDVLEVVDLVTSYIFRRAVCRIPTNSLNKTFAGFSSAVRKDRYLDSVKAHFLTLKSYRRFPKDNEFLDALKSSDLYNFRRRSYFLRVLENHGRKEHVTIEDYTIEHILPQNDKLSTAWQAALGDDWQDVQQKYLHTLGNLTLTGYNSEYSDHSFAKKRDMEGGFRDSPLRLNKGLGQLESWNAEEIQKRAAWLADDALKIWTMPQLAPEVLEEFEEARAESDFSIEDHPHLLPQPRRALFEKFSDEVLALDPGITQQFLKLYVAFKAETNFVDVVPQKARMRLSLNIPLEVLHDERNLAWDVSGKGHWGNGPTEVALDEDSDLSYILGLVRQAFEYQMGGE